MKNQDGQIEIVLAVVLTLGVLLASGLTFAAVQVYRAGSVAIEVHDPGPDGVDLSLRVPAVLVSGAALVIPFELPEDVAAELRPHLPVVETVLDELSRCPDFVLVEVESGRDHVEIAKRDGELVISVTSGGESFALSVPLGAARSVVARLGRACRA
jgi:hypothetical protein